METVVGVFPSSVEARGAARALAAQEFTADEVQLLLPGHGGDFARLPTDDAEPPGVARTLGAVVGGAAGGALGLGLGAAVATLLLPGVGPVTAIGLGAAALLGAGGAAGVAAAADALEEKTTPGLPRDELYLYEDALALGRSIVFVLAPDEDRAKSARAVLESEGAESLDAARESWWMGLREPEKERYERSGSDFEADEASYRKGFEAGQHPDLDGDSVAAFARLPEWDPARKSGAAFRHGYERGRERRYRRLLEETAKREERRGVPA